MVESATPYVNDSCGNYHTCCVFLSFSCWWVYLWTPLSTTQGRFLAHFWWNLHLSTMNSSPSTQPIKCGERDRANMKSWFLNLKLLGDVYQKRQQNTQILLNCVLWFFNSYQTVSLYKSTKMPLLTKNPLWILKKQDLTIYICFWMCIDKIVLLEGLQEKIIKDFFMPY